jgi:4-hydroxy-tetrahydrodipicolinate synthase
MRRATRYGRLLMPLRPQGVLAACVTPFRDDETLDLDRLGSHIDFMLDAGIDGVMLIGGCGEYANLTPDERKSVVTEGINAISGRGPVVVGVLAPSTREVLDIGMHAANAGADALLVLPPYYIKPSFDGVLEHFQTIVKETGMDVIAYNIPGRTGTNLGVPELRQIAEIPGVVALKECERDMASISLKIIAVGDEMPVLSGDDDLGFATLTAGARGAIWASPNLAPKLCADLYAASVAGDIPTALALHNRLVQIFAAWMLPNHPGPLKQAMGLVGRSVGPVRTPLKPMSDTQLANLRDALQAHGPVA